MPKPNPFAAFVKATSAPTTDRPEWTKVTVPNTQPLIEPTAYRIAVIGEAPGSDEVTAGKPFVGFSGRLLTRLLSEAHIIRDQCFVGNICQHRPSGNDISQFSLAGDEIRQGLSALATDLATFRPNVCLLLGKTALWAANGETAIGNWRGSLFVGTKEPFVGLKCLASYHPAACLRQYEWTPQLFFDIKKALRNATTPYFISPPRDLKVGLSFAELVAELENVLATKPLISPDLEGYWHSVECISIATAGDRSFLLPFFKNDGTSCWSIDEEADLLALLSRIMADPEIPKIWQNGLYDRFVLQYGLNIVCRGNKDDTMLKFWELFCELPKGLGFQCSVLLEHEPFYKEDRKSEDQRTSDLYCCRDSANTFANCESMDRFLSNAQRQHYVRNNDLLNPLLYMELRGIRYNKALAKSYQAEITDYIYELQPDLDRIAGRGLQTNDKEVLLALVRDTMCWKRDQSKVKKEYEDVFDSCVRLLLGPAELTKQQLGRLSMELGTSLNVDSPQQVKDFLYDQLKLPVQSERKKRGEEPSITSDITALLKLKRLVTNPIQDKAVTLLIDIGQLLTRQSLLNCKTDPDGRVRCGYNLVGTETGRIASYSSPTGSGFNLQTVTKGIPYRPEGHPLKRGMRDLFLADEGYYIFECDLSGADGWTVGAHLAALGDPTMLDDLKAGIKPAARICYMLRHGNNSLAHANRDEVKTLLRSIKKDDWDYFACKQGIWGICYTMGPDKLATTIAKRSGGALWLDRTAVESFRTAVFSCYNVQLWHRSCERHIRKEAVLTAPNGFRRKFYGRPTEILGEFLAHEPQVNTTHATNTALYRLWTDPENRWIDTENRVLDLSPTIQAELTNMPLRSDLPYRAIRQIEPLHTIHDALLGQFRIEDTAWAITKIREWFSNTIVIAGISITIPFEGHYGTNWSLDDSSKIGEI